MTNWRGWLRGTCVLVVLGISIDVVAQSDEADRIREATTVLREIMNAPDSGMPDWALDASEAIAVFPSTIKAGFLIGVQRGSGIISVRDHAKHEWSAPAFLTITGASFGPQIGGQSIDFVLLVRNRRGVEHLLQNQFKIGAGAAVSAGPVGRNAEASTDIQLQAEILSYSRSRGLFAGLSLKGSAIRQDRDANRNFYGKRFRSREIVLDGKATMPRSPDAVAEWRQTLTGYSRVH